ncbi:MAG: OmpA family protein [Spirochaetales bacterium]|nr:OmpA family protein [Spirochaetales bacterium]
MKKTRVLFLLLFICQPALWADRFAYKFTQGDQYRILTTVKENVYYNGQLAHTAEILDKIALKVTQAAGGSGTFSARFQVSQRFNTYWGVYLEEEEQTSTYTVDRQGRFSIAAGHFFPLTRDIPLFPDRELKAGETWSSPGIEIHDLRSPYGIAEPYRVPVNVETTYLGASGSGGRPLAKFDIRYSYMTKVNPHTPPAGPYYPVMISGTMQKILFWDAALGRMDSYTEDFDVFYYLSNGTMVEFVGTHSGKVIPAQILDARRAAEDIDKEIQKNRLEGVRAEPTSDGVKITLENVQFEPDSDRIIAREARKLDIIASILKRYTDRDIKLVGHTAAVGTPESCLELSIRRAAAVGNALLERGARRADRMTIQGKGLTEPVAPNTTVAGRIKNRRVEIFILEN